MTQTATTIQQNTSVMKTFKAQPRMKADNATNPAENYRVQGAAPLWETWGEHSLGNQRGLNSWNHFELLSHLSPRNLATQNTVTRGKSCQRTILLHHNRINNGTFRLFPSAGIMASKLTELYGHLRHNMTLCTLLFCL